MSTQTCPELINRQLWSPYPSLTALKMIESKRSKRKNITSHVLRTQQSESDSQRTVVRTKQDSMIIAGFSRVLSRPKWESVDLMIADFSKTFCLPTLDGGRKRMKFISSDTMSNLLNGAYKHSVASFQIIDCRYPYEFNGGHICMALNLCSKQLFMEELLCPKIGTVAAVAEADVTKRNILVFYSEFSNTRAHQACRFLRDRDRKHNENVFPNLFYPEIYVLYGGYKQFYKKYPYYCDPIDYVPMNGTFYERQLKKNFFGDYNGNREMPSVE